MNAGLSRLLINCIAMLDIPTVLAEIMRLAASLQRAGPASCTLGPYGQTSSTGISQHFGLIEAMLVSVEQTRDSQEKNKK